MNELLEFIKAHRDKTLSVKYTDDKRFEFLEYFFNEYKFINFKTLMEADRVSLLTVLIIYEHPDLDVDMVYNFFADHENLLYVMQSEEFNVLENSLISSKKGLLQKVISYFEKEKIKDYSEIYNFYKDNNISITSLGINAVINEIGDEIAECDMICESYEDALQSKIRDKYKKKMKLEYLKQTWKIDQILEPLSKARSFYDSKVKEKKSFEKKYNKLVRSYDELITKISFYSSRFQAIEISDGLFGTIDDTEFRKHVLREIYLYNKEQYVEVQKRYDDIMANSVLNYKALLEKYGIFFEETEINSIMFNSISDLEEMLLILKQKSITSPEVLALIIKTSNLQILKNYNSLMDIGVITKELLLDNLDLVNPDSLLYKNFINVLNMIQERKINPYIFNQSQNIYLIDINILVNNIDILIEYNLFDSLKVGYSYNFFNEINLSEAIDTLLELGFEKYLENDLTILNYCNRFKRLSLLKALNMPINSKDELISYLADDKFFVPDSMIGDYIYMNNDNPDINIDTTNAIETPRTYIVNDKIISKNRILRLLPSNQAVNLKELKNNKVNL